MFETHSLVGNTTGNNSAEMLGPPTYNKRLFPEPSIKEIALKLTEIHINQPNQTYYWSKIEVVEVYIDIYDKLRQELDKGMAK